MRLVVVTVGLSTSLACTAGTGIGAGAFDRPLTVTVTSPVGGETFEAEPIPFRVEIDGAPDGAEVTVRDHVGLPIASFAWPDDDGVDVIHGGASGAGTTFTFSVVEPLESRTPETFESNFWITWSNPSPVTVEACDADACAPIPGELATSTVLRPSGPMDDAIETRWYVDDVLLGVGDPEDGSLAWAWTQTAPESHAVRVWVRRDGAPDSFGGVGIVTRP